MIELPAFFSRANERSLEGQRRHLLARQSQLLLLVVASIAGATWTIEESVPGAITAVGAFVAAASVSVWSLRSRAQAAWYQGRAAAESAKTLAWSYAVGGRPLALRLSPDRADQIFVDRLREVASRLDPKIADYEPTVREITEWMRNLRSAPLNERKASYRAERLGSQLAWYQAKAEWNRSRWRLWNILLATAAVAGAALAGAAAIGILQMDLFSVVAVVAAGGMAWIETKSHGSLAEAYRVTALELETIGSSAISVETEEQWQEFVGDAEQAISREHTMWAASHS